MQSPLSSWHPFPQQRSSTLASDSSVNMMAQPIIMSPSGSWLPFDLQRQHSLSAFFPSSPQPDFGLMTDAAVEPLCPPSPTASYHSLPSVESAASSSSVPSSSSSASSSSPAVCCSPFVPGSASVSPPAASAAAAAVSGGKQPRKQACVLCRHSKVSCNGQRPCDRCLRLDRAEVCVNPVRKPRKHALLIPALPYPTPALRGQQEQQQHAGHTQLVLQQEQPVGYAALSAAADSVSVKQDVDSVLLVDGQSLSSQLSRLTLESMMQQLTAEFSSGIHRTFRMSFMFRKLHSLMQPADLSLLIHALEQNIKSWRRGVLRLLLRAGDGATDSGHECSSRLCMELCGATRRIFVMRPLAFTFAASPAFCSDDSFHCKYPTLMVRMEAAVAGFRQRVRAMPLWPSPQPWPLLELPVTVQVNRAFELAFGLDQRTVRQLFASHSFFAQFLLFPPGEWRRLMQLEVVAETGTEPGYQSCVLCQHRLGSSFRAFLDKTLDKDDEGVCIGYEMTFIPIKHDRHESQDALQLHTDSFS